MAKLQRAIREAQRVIAQERVTSVPVDIEKLASKWALIVKDRLDTDLSGMLVPVPESTDVRKWAIVVNRDHSRVRQRFTIAHELGHLLLHGYTSAHADRGFKIRWRDSTSSEGSVLEEIEANRFAAEVLMPLELLRRRLLDSPMEYAPLAGSDKEGLSKLAKDFDVSTQALSIRISTLVT